MTENTINALKAYRNNDLQQLYQYVPRDDLEENKIIRFDEFRFENYCQKLIEKDDICTFKIEIENPTNPRLNLNCLADFSLITQKYDFYQYLVDKGAIVTLESYIYSENPVTFEYLIKNQTKPLIEYQLLYLINKCRKFANVRCFEILLNYYPHISSIEITKQIIENIIHTEKRRTDGTYHGILPSICTDKKLDFLKCVYANFMKSPSFNQYFLMRYYEIAVRNNILYIKNYIEETYPHI